MAMTDTNDSTDPADSIELTIRDSDAREIEMRTIMLGYAPIILIEPVSNKDGSVTTMIDVTDASLEGTADLLEYLANALRSWVVE